MNKLQLAFLVVSVGMRWASTALADEKITAQEIVDLLQLIASEILPAAGVDTDIKISLD